VSIAGAKGENMVWGWGWVSAAWVRVPQKVREMSGNLTLTGEWSPCQVMSERVMCAVTV